MVIIFDQDHQKVIMPEVSTSSALKQHFDQDKNWLQLPCTVTFKSWPSSKLLFLGKYSIFLTSLMMTHAHTICTHLLQTYWLRQRSTRRRPSKVICCNNSDTVSLIWWRRSEEGGTECSIPTYFHLMVLYPSRSILQSHSICHLGTLRSLWSEPTTATQKSSLILKVNKFK